MPHETSKILYVLAMLCYDYKYVQADIAYALYYRFLQQSHNALKRNHSHSYTACSNNILGMSLIVSAGNFEMVT